MVIEIEADLWRKVSNCWDVIICSSCRVSTKHILTEETQGICTPSAFFSMCVFLIHPTTKIVTRRHIESGACCYYVFLFLQKETNVVRMILWFSHLLKNIKKEEHFGSIQYREDVKSKGTCLGCGMIMITSIVYVGMSVALFDRLLVLLETHIRKMPTNFHNPTDPHTHKYVSQDLWDSLQILLWRRRKRPKKTQKGRTNRLGIKRGQQHKQQTSIM